MSDRAIIVEGLSKSYLINRAGRERYTTLRDVMARKTKQLLKSITRPFASSKAAGVGGREEFWALRDISFEVRQGERIGIIGRNGAGKSTLLKILSRITSPTKGSIKIHGRVGSLLEVGTGFHPELSGRENIFLNGAIIGMRNAEIRKKFDEIVAFAEVEKFLDTPVKHYSSGMYVRLAFAVAAHLEPEILIVDEVLAVGDSQFQKKCLGKMGDVSKNQGRTVLFVSHNMTAIKSLCNSALLLEKGMLIENGNSDDVVTSYIKKGNKSSSAIEWNDPLNAPGNENAYLKSVKLLNAENISIGMCDISEPVLLEIEYCVQKSDTILNLSISIFNQEDIYILASPSVTDHNWFLKKHPVGLFKSKCIIPANLLNAGCYGISVLLVDNGRHIIGQADRIVSIEMVDSGLNRGGFFGPWSGVVRPSLAWNTTLVDKKSG
jgi:lipopolysaccharide transport system ATP-binding protein